MSTITVDAEGLDDVARLLSRLGLMPNEAINFARLAIKAKEIVLVRTDSGRDASGTSFAPYSSAYEAFKSRTHSDLSVNLQYSNNMLAAMATDENQTRSRVFFADSVNANKAQWHNEGTSKIPKREFFAISTDEIDSEIIPLVQSDIDDFIGGAI